MKSFFRGRGGSDWPGNILLATCYYLGRRMRIKFTAKPGRAVFDKMNLCYMHVCMYIYIPLITNNRQRFSCFLVQAIYIDQY